jgi:hypothetical protein
MAPKRASIFPDFFQKKNPSQPSSTNNIVMKPTLRQRVEELQARKDWRTGRPKWLHKPKILNHVKEAEMVSLSRDSNFAKIPAELQLHVISYLDYDAVLKLKGTCRYFNYFINADVIEASKVNQVEHYQQMETHNTLPSDQLPCYTCLKMKPKAEYYHKKGRYYMNAQPYRSHRQTAARNPDFERQCIRCGFQEGLYDPGTKLNTGGQSWLICSSCGFLAKEPQDTTSSASGTSCKPCTVEYNFMRGHGTSIRMLQWMVAVVILPLACSGKAMPWTSRANEDSLRWIFNITVVRIPGSLVLMDTDVR